MRECFFSSPGIILKTRAAGKIKNSIYTRVASQFQFGTTRVECEVADDGTRRACVVVDDCIRHGSRTIRNTTHDIMIVFIDNVTVFYIYLYNV